MELLQKKNFINAVERVLHVKGNYSGGILEMTLVIDCALPKEYVIETAADIGAVLRAHSQVFRNVRLNLLYWQSEEELENHVIPISFLQMNSCFQDYKICPEKKSLDVLSDRLKLLHARSKLILVLSNEEPLIHNREIVKQNMHPFLGKKSLFLCRSNLSAWWRRGEELL